MALGGEFGLEAGGHLAHGPAAVVSADQNHAFTAEGLVALLFIEPESVQGRALRATLAGRPLTQLSDGVLGDLPRRLAQGFRSSAPASELTATGRELIACLAGESEPMAADPRVARVIAWASAELDHALSIAEAADLVGLSPGRMSHLFVEQTGLPFRTYVLWLRLMKSVEAFAAGESLTAAAYEAGFSDSAHLSRTFRRMFGVTAAALELT